MAEGAGACAFTAEFGLVAQGDVDHTALAAVHRVEAKRRAGVLDFFGRGAGTDAEFLDAQSAIIVGVEGNARMVVGVEAENLLRHEFESKKKLSAIGEEHFDVVTQELDYDVGVFEIGVALIAGFDGEIEGEPGSGDDLAQEFLDAWTGLVDRKPGTQALFLPFFWII